MSQKDASTIDIDSSLKADVSYIEDSAGKKKFQPKLRGIDEATQYLEDDDQLNPTDEEIKKLVRKIDFHILPILGMCYVFFYIDKTTLSYAAIFGIKDDLKLHGTEYSWLSSIFYFGYLFWSFPTNYLLLKLPVGKYLGANIFLWGIFLMIQAACPSFATLAVVRALAGAAEAVADPAFLIVTSMYYTRREQPVKIGIWYACNGAGIAFGGLLGYGIGHIKGSLPSWKYEFIIIGAACAIWGIMIVILLPDNPLKAKFLTEREKKILVYRQKGNQTGIETKVFKWGQVKEVFLDPKSYALFLIAFFANIPNGGVSNFGTLIIQGFGFSTLGTTLLQIPNGAVVSLSILSCVYINDRWVVRSGKNRRTVMLVLYMLPNVAGAFGLYFLSEAHKGGRLVCYYLTGPYNAAFVLALSLNTSNVAGHTKKVVTNGFLFLGYCVGNIAGPFFYKTSQAPRYPLGMGSLMFSHLMEIIVAVLLGFYLKRENTKRDQSQGISNETDYEYDDRTDKENLNFRYVY